MTTQLLIEVIDLSEATIREDGSVRQVLIRAGTSTNGRHYAADVLLAAAPLFEGVRTFNGHPSRADIKARRERTPLELTGWVSNIEFNVEEDALVGVRHFTNTATGRDAKAMIEQVVKGDAPGTLIGSSINAIGVAKEEQRDGKKVMVIESIVRAHSVDDVVQPAAGGGFAALVASDGDDLTGALLEQMDYDEWFAARPDLTERFIKQNKKVRRNAQQERSQADVAKYRTLNENAQATIQQLQEDLETARQQVARAELSVLVVDTLTAVKLPSIWKTSLREQLMDIVPKKWDAIIQSEIKKAQRVKATPRVSVTGQGQQIAESVKLPDINRAPYPLDGENAQQYARRQSALQM